MGLKSSIQKGLGIKRNEEQTNFFDPSFRKDFPKEGSLAARAEKYMEDFKPGDLNQFELYVEEMMHYFNQEKLGKKLTAPIIALVTHYKIKKMMDAKDENKQDN